jgi:rod shape determining protein RodA
MSRSERTRATPLQRVLRRIDWPLLILICTIASVGIYNMHSASSAVNAHINFHVVQGVAFFVGLIFMGLICIFDYRIWARWSYWIYGFVAFLLVLVELFGKTLNGSTRWLDLGFFLLQPSELLKVGVIMLTARYFQDRDQSEPYDLFQLARLFGMVGAVVLLVLKQPDLGTSLVVLAIFMSMVVFQGIRWTSVAVLVLGVALSSPVIWSVGLHDYQKERVISFLQLEDDDFGHEWQVRQAIIAFGSGRAWGKGHGEGTQVQGGFVPEHENDFAAANWGEEQGFVGMVFLLSLYAALILWCLRISASARDRYGAIVGVGVASFLTWHVGVNLGMVTGMLPVVGIPLPLFSYGRSSMMTFMFAFGLLMNVSMRRTAWR